MTDTAQPFPDEADAPEPVDHDAPAEGSILRPSQLRRVAALRGAREALTARGGIFGGSNVNDWTTDDLIEVADWILDGQAPEISWPSPVMLLGTLYGPAGWCKPADFTEGRVQPTEPESQVDDPETEAGDPIDPDDIDPETDPMQRTMPLLSADQAEEAEFNWDSSGALPK